MEFQLRVGARVPFFGDVNQLRGDIIANNHFNLNSLCCEPVKEIMRLEPIATAEVQKDQRSLYFIIFAYHELKVVGIEGSDDLPLNRVFIHVGRPVNVEVSAEGAGSIVLAL